MHVPDGIGEIIEALERERFGDPFDGAGRTSADHP